MIVKLATSEVSYYSGVCVWFGCGESSPGDLEYARNDESACSHKLARLARALTKMQLEL